MTARHRPLPRRLNLPIVVALLAALLFAGLWWAFEMLRPMPPGTLVMATGLQGGAYAQAGARYREILSRAGVRVRLEPTAGAVENLQRLRDPRSGVSAAFVQSGTTNVQESPELASLGAMFFDPLWIFARGTPRSAGIDALRGRRISIGPVGSGTRALAEKLLALEGIDARNTELFPFTPEEAETRLDQGAIDFAAIMTAWESPSLRRLLADPGIRLVSLPRADAYVALYPVLTKVVLPAGVGDLAKNLPPADVTLIGLKSSLVVRKDIHPALQYLLLEAAAQIHSGPGILHIAGTFPSPEGIDLPLSDEARQYYKSGPPFLQRYLPFWLAVLAERLLVVLIPAAGVVYPLVRILPSAYGWNARNRILRLYGELKLLETEMDGSGGRKQELLPRLEKLEERTNHLKLPAFYMQSLYTLKDHIQLVRQRIERQG